jgi:hypothetical protein
MKRVFFLAIFAASTLAQAQAVGLPMACGPENASFKVRLEDKPSVQAQPAPGKALVYFIHDSGSPAVFAYPTMKIGVDGAWVGADHSNSYFFTSVDAGVHHLCATLQSSLVDGRSEFVHFRAEAGKLYYYRTRLVLSRSVELLELEPIDSDEGRYLATSYPLSVSTPKK